MVRRGGTPRLYGVCGGVVSRRLRGLWVSGGIVYVHFVLSCFVVFIACIESNQMNRVGYTHLTHSSLPPSLPFLSIPSQDEEMRRGDECDCH